MIVFAILALAVMADGYRLQNPPSSPVRNNVLSWMCEQNGVNNTIVEIAGANYIECTEANFGMQMFKTEFTEAPYNDSYSKLFKKDCAKITQLKYCYHTLLDAVSPCIGERNEVLISTTKNILDQILDFLCDDDGLVISRFITEGGPQCLQSKSNEIITCGRNFENSLLNMDLNITLPAAHSHRKFGDLLTCVLRNLETCNNSIPSKAFKSIVDIVRQSVSKLARELSDKVTPEQVWDHVKGTQHVPAVMADGYRLHNPSSSPVQNNVLSRMCERNGVNNSIVEIAGANYIECAESNFGMQMFEKESTEAQYNDSYSKLFKKDCAKITQLKYCYHTLLDAVSPCIGERNEVLIPTTKNIMDQILDFLCEDDDGLVISRFITEGGPQCLQNKSNEIITCVRNFENALLNKDLNITLPAAHSHRKYGDLLTCVLRNLKTCNNSIPSKVFKSATYIVRQSVSELARELSDNVTTEQVLDHVIGTQHVPAVMADGYRLHNPSSSPVQNNVLSRMCERNGVNNSIVEIAGANYIECAESNFGMQMFEKESTEAQYNDSYSKLFKKDCAKITQLKDCYHTLLDAVSPCIGERNEVLIPTTKNIMDQILDFLCEDDDGLVISRFITEGGPQCLQNKSNEIITCVRNFENALLNKDLNITLPAAHSHRKYGDLLTCVLRNLKTCNNSIPSKVFKSATYIVRQSVSELARELSDNVTTEQVLDHVIGTQHVPAVMADGYRLHNPSSSPVQNNVLSRMCERNGVNNSIVEIAGANYIECAESNFGMQMFEKESTEAQYNDSYSKLFKKDCAKITQLKYCYHTLLDAVSPCIGERNEVLIPTTKNIMDQILDFLCEDDDGLVISRFITEGGPQCLQNKSNEIITCVRNFENALLNKDLNITLPAAHSHRKYGDLLTCVLRNLKTCNNSIPSKVFKSATYIVRQSVSELARELSDNVTTEQVLDHVIGTQHVPAVMADGYRLHNPSSSPVQNNVLSRMCERNGVNNSIVEIAGANYIECAESNFGMQMFEKESTEAQYNDSYSKLFKKDCAKITQLKYCYHTLLDAVSPCIGERNEVLIPTTKNIMDQILDFLCEDDDGLVISRFITEGGPQCLQNKSNEIITCVRNFENALLNKDLNITLPAAHSHRKYGDLLTCVLRNLKTCNNSIPSKVFKSATYIVRQSVSELARELSDNVTTEQVLDHVIGTQHVPAVMADGYRLHNPSSSPVQNNVLSRMCERNGVNNSIVEIAGANYIECAESNFGMQMFEKESTEAQYNDSYSKLFKKDCAKITQLKYCYHTLLDAVSPCIGERNEVLIPTTKNIMDQILDFLCEDDDGLVISRFITEGGPQCLQNKSNEIITCVRNFENALLNKDLNITLPAAHSHRKYGDLLTCVLRNLKTCNNSIPSKVFKSATYIVRQSVSELARELSDNVTTEQVLDHVIGTQHVPAVMADGYRLHNPSSSPVQNNVLSRMCERNGVNNSIVEIAGANYIECAESNFGMQMFEKESTEAQYNDSYSKLFKKDCAKITQLKDCYHTLLDAVSPCIGERNEVLIPTTKNIMDQILDFLCEDDDGLVISRFITEGGPQCLQNKSNEIITCVRNFENALLNKDLNITLPAAHSHRKYGDLLTCVLRNLETCNNSIPSKVFNSVAYIVRLSVSELARDLSDNVTTEQVLDHVNGTQHVPARSAANNNLQMLCEKNGADYKAVQAIGVQSVACMEDGFGIKMLQRDLKEAQNNGSYAEVFKRYCPRTLLLKTCIHALIYGVSPCFGDEAQDYITTTMTTYDRILDYVCQSDGDRIARFLAEGGLECLKSKSHDIMMCAENSKNSFLQGWTITSSVSQIYGTNDKLLNCILKNLETCDNPAAYKVLESAAEIIRNSYSHQTGNNIMEKTTKSLIRVSGTVVLAFSVDIFV